MRASKLRFSVKGVGALGVALVMATTIYAASGVSVSLNLQRGFKNRQLAACGIKHHYTFYHRRHRIPFDGTVNPAPHHSFRVKVKVKKCRSGSFRTVFAIHVRGSGSTGHFRGHLRSPGRGFFYARAYFYGIPPQKHAVARSDKEFFRVTKR